MTLSLNHKGAFIQAFFIDIFLHDHDPAIMIIMKTHIGSERARDNTKRLSFDGANHTDIIRFSSGLWLLWNSDKISITQLEKIE